MGSVPFLEEAVSGFFVSVIAGNKSSSIFSLVESCSGLCNLYQEIFLVIVFACCLMKFGDLDCFMGTSLEFKLKPRENQGVLYHKSVLFLLEMKSMVVFCGLSCMTSYSPGSFNRSFKYFYKGIFYINY